MSNVNSFAPRHSRSAVLAAGRLCRTLGLLLLLLTIATATVQSEPTVAELRAAAQANPTDPEPWVNLGNGYLFDERFDLAKEAFLEAIALDYRNGDAHFGLGLAEFGRGDLEAALFAFNEVTRLFPDRFDGHYNRAVTLARLGRSADAAEAFGEAVAQAEPEAAAQEIHDAFVGLASQLTAIGDFAGAAEAYGDALAQEDVGDEAELAYRRAESLYRAGRGLEALPDLTELESAGSDHRVSSLIADIYLGQGQTDYALRALERGVRQARQAGDDAAESALLVRTALLERQLGRHAEALATLEAAAQSDPSSWTALYNLGVLYLDSGQAGVAVTVLEQAARVPAAPATVDLALATAYERQGRPSDAVASARRAALALVSEPDLQSQARLIEGRALYRLGEYRAAADLLAETVRLRPADPQAQLWAGLAHHQLGDYLGAAQYYERAVQLAPNDLEARANLGAAYLAAQRYSDAEAVFGALTQLEPADAESHFYLGWSLMSQNRRAEAREAWRQASELGYTPAAEALDTHFP